MKRVKHIDPFLNNNIHLVSKKFTRNKVPLGYYKVCKPPKGFKNDIFGLWIYYKNSYFKLALGDLTKGTAYIKKVKRIRCKNGTKKRRTIKRGRLGFL